MPSDGAAADAGQRSSTAMRLLGLVRASHPFPIAMVLSLTLLIGLVSAGDRLDAGRLGLALLAMLCSQLAIGWSNDYLDRDRDATSQPAKPVPSGLVPASWLLVLTPAVLSVAVVSGAALGAPVVGWLLVGTACGFAYNLALKDSAWSWAPYVAAFAALPLFVWAATHSFRDEFLWLYAIGAPLAVAAHLANTLPDIAGDTAAGSRGVAVRLGRERALVALFACLVLSPLVVLLSLIWLDYDAVLLAAAVVAYLALLLAASVAYRQTPFERGAALGFRIIAPAAVILAAGWLAAL